MDYSELKKISDFTHDPAVTISLRTHRTSPKNQKDAIVLKNLINETEERLLELYDKRKVWGVMDNLRALETELNHQQNLDTLIYLLLKTLKKRLSCQLKLKKILLK